MKWFGCIVIALFPVLGMAQDCSSFKTGKFYVKDEQGNRIPDYTIVRKKKKQIEYLPNGGKSVSKVEWTSDCTYTLTNVKSKMFGIPPGTVTSVKITRTFEGGYEGIGNSSAVGVDRPFTMYVQD